MCVYVYIKIHRFIHVCVCVHIYTHLYIYRYTHTHICRHMLMNICTYSYTYKCTHITVCPDLGGMGPPSRNQHAPAASATGGGGLRQGGEVDVGGGGTWECDTQPWVAESATAAPST